MLRKWSRIRKLISGAIKLIKLMVQPTTAINTIDQAIEAAKIQTLVKTFKCNNLMTDRPTKASIFSILKIYNLITLITIVTKVEKLCCKKLSNKEIVKLCNLRY